MTYRLLYLVSRNPLNCYGTVPLAQAPVTVLSFSYGIQNTLTMRTEYRTFGKVLRQTDSTMAIFTVTEARANLYRLVDETADSHEPIIIQGKRSRAVLISEGDWRSMQETMHLLGIPGVRESIRLGMETPLEECDGEPGW